MSERRDRGPGPPGFLVCLATLVFVDVVLRTSGLRGAVRWAHRLGRHRAPNGADSAGVIPPTVRKMAMAATLYPRRALCLEQSVGLYILLARRGLPVDLRIGVHPMPFSAHAWVEYQGRPVNEREDFVNCLTPFPSFEG